MVLYYNTSDLKQAKLVLALAFSNGWSWAGGNKSLEVPQDCEGFSFYDNKVIRFSACPYSETMNTTQLASFLMTGMLPKPTIMIGEYKVEFQKGSIKVGCKTVSNDVVEQIYNNLER